MIPTLLNYQYRAYPDTNQKLELNSWLRTCRYWYNWQLGDRFNWWQRLVPTVEAILLEVNTDLETRLANPPVTSVLNSLNAGQIQILHERSLIQQITQFVSNVLSQPA